MATKASDDVEGEAPIVNNPEDAPAPVRAAFFMASWISYWYGSMRFSQFPNIHFDSEDVDKLMLGGPDYFWQQWGLVEPEHKKRLQEAKHHAIEQGHKVNEEEIADKVPQWKPYFSCIYGWWTCIFWLCTALQYPTYEQRGYQSTALAAANEILGGNISEGVNFWTGDNTPGGLDFHACMDHCNEADGCDGIAFHHTPTSECLLMTGFIEERDPCASGGVEATTNPFCRFSSTTWKRNKYSGAEAFGARLSQIGGIEPFAWQKTSLMVHDRFCKGFSTEIYRYWTYQFSHAGISHMLECVLTLLFFGIPLESYLGPLLLILFYQIGVICGGISQVIIQSHGSVVGASGGSYCLITMTMMHVIVNWPSKKPTRGETKWRKITLTIFVLAFIGSCITLLPAGLASNPHGTNVTLIGGAAIGAVIGLAIFGEEAATKSARRGLIIWSVLTGIWFLFCIIWFWTNPFPGTRDIVDTGDYCWVGQVCIPDTFTDSGGNKGQCDPTDVTSPFQCVQCLEEECVNSWYFTCSGTQRFDRLVWKTEYQGSVTGNNVAACFGVRNQQYWNEDGSQEGLTYDCTIANVEQGFQEVLQGDNIIGNSTLRT